MKKISTRFSKDWASQFFAVFYSTSLLYGHNNKKNIFQKRASQFLVWRFEGVTLRVEKKIEKSIEHLQDEQLCADCGR